MAVAGKTFRKIIHIDMDCFYAAVEVKYRPELKGKPLGVGGLPNTRSVLTTASYEARKFGVKSAMPSSQAVRLCPQIILVPPNMELYKKESRAVRQILERFTSKIEPLSLDEAYLDVSEASAFQGSATLIAQEIRRLIQVETGLTASAGIAPNKFLAKVASDWKKPNGQFVIRPEDVLEFVQNLKIEKLYGVGKVTAKRMHELGLYTCADLRRQNLHQMTKWFGCRGADLLELAQGVDHRKVETSSERKSLTVEETFAVDLKSLEECQKHLPELYQDWKRRMQRAHVAERIRGLVVKVKYHDFKDTTHQMSSSSWPTLDQFETLLKRIWQKRAKPVRLLGLGVRLTSEAQETNGPQLRFDC
ncbi:MAG: DNA polymerase IV [Bdellovibrio sp.]